MKNLLFAAGFAVLAAGACNSSSSKMGDNTTTTATVPAEREMNATMTNADLTDPDKVVETVGTYGGLTKLPVATATSVIDGYIGKLSGMAGTGSLVSDLRTVKMELNSGNIDGAKVGAALTRLGMTTQRLADGNASYATLGSALEQSGKMLTGK